MVDRGTPLGTAKSGQHSKQDELNCTRFDGKKGHMIDSHSSSHDAQFDVAGSTRTGRGPTRLRTISLGRTLGERLFVDIDVLTGVASGPHAENFSSYLGVLARDRISILVNAREDVTEAERDALWQDIQTHFNVPNVGALRSKVLSSIAAKFRHFKSILTSTYIFGAKQGQSPCGKYPAIDEETWNKFVHIRRDDSWRDVRKKAQDIQKKNVTPHILSRGGYKKLEEHMMREKQAAKEAKAASQGNPNAGPPSPPSPPSRHEKWKKARLRGSGTFTSKESCIVAERIDSLVEDSTQGLFRPQGRRDILVEAIGRPEHPGRVRAAGPGVGIRSYFGPAVQTSSSGVHNEKSIVELKERIT